MKISIIFSIILLSTSMNSQDVKTIKELEYTIFIKSYCDDTSIKFNVFFKNTSRNEIYFDNSCNFTKEIFIIMPIYKRELIILKPNQCHIFFNKIVYSKTNDSTINILNKIYFDLNFVNIGLVEDKKSFLNSFLYNYQNRYYIDLLYLSKYYTNKHEFIYKFPCYSPN